MELPNIYLCDIDGTLAKHEGRSPYDESKVSTDSALPTCRVIQAIINNEGKVIYFSGRTKKCYIDSYEWLTQHVHSGVELYMREIGDQRGDDIVKKEMYEKYIKGKYNVLGVFDDRLKVCRMWYELGLFVFNCNQGLKEF